jgi:hypothetical protein
MNRSALYPVAGGLYRPDPATKEAAMLLCPAPAIHKPPTVPCSICGKAMYPNKDGRHPSCARKVGLWERRPNNALTGQEPAQ